MTRTIDPESVFVPAPKRLEPRPGDIWNRPLKDPDYDASQKARQAVFAKIAPKPNWKRGIDAWIDEKDLRDCEEAAIYFCGSILDVVERKRGKVRVVGAGYYSCIGS